MSEYIQHPVWNTMSNAERNSWLQSKFAGSSLADYTSDLNAVSVLESRLDSNQRVKYSRILSYHVSSIVYEGKTQEQLASEETAHSYYFAMATVSAFERCSALFLCLTEVE